MTTISTCPGTQFQDDDDAAGFEADDEDTKEAKERVRGDHLGANMFGEGKEDEVDKEEKEQRDEKSMNKELGKQIVKGLVNLEHAMDYKDDVDSEGEDNIPFKDSSVHLRAPPRPLSQSPRETRRLIRSGLRIRAGEGQGRCQEGR